MPTANRGATGEISRRLRIDDAPGEGTIFQIAASEDVYPNASHLQALQPYRETCRQIIGGVLVRVAASSRSSIRWAGARSIWQWTFPTSLPRSGASAAWRVTSPFILLARVSDHGIVMLLEFFSYA